MKLLGGETRCGNDCVEGGWGLPTLALLLADEGQVGRAVELCATATRFPVIARSRWFEAVVGRHLAALAAGLPPDEVAAAEGRGRGREPAATVLGVLGGLGDGQHTRRAITWFD